MKLRNNSNARSKLKELLNNSQFKSKATLLIVLFAILPIGVITSLAIFSTQHNEDSYCTQLNDPNNQLEKILVEIVNTPFSLELASTASERRTGLMCRTEIGSREGMLFIFEEEEYRSFWMKNTLVPLDIIFLDSNGIIINIHKHTQILNENIYYRSESPSKFVIELNGGTTDEIKLKKGDSINIENLNKL